MSAYSSSLPNWPICFASAEACRLSTGVAAVTVGFVWALGLAIETGSACEISICGFDAVSSMLGACNFPKNSWP